MKKEIDPISKLKIFGPKKLTDTEILSILIYSGNKKKSYYEISKNLIEYFGNLKSVLQQSIGTLIEQDGMTEAKAMQLVLINEVTNRVKSRKAFPYNITKYDDVIDYVYKNNNNLGEFFSIIFLDNNENYLGHKIISESLSNRMNVNILEINRISVYNNSRKVIIFHNHPNGIELPSISDIEFTIDVKETLLVCGIELLNHYIVLSDKRISILDYI